MSKKDSVSKEFFKTPERFADTCNGILFGGCDIISPLDLSEEDVEYAYINRSDNKSIVDIAKKWKKNDTIIALIALENQTYTDYGMVLRNMLSESLMYNRQLKDKTREHRKNNELMTGSELLSGITKDDMFTPIITIVVYLGKEKWDGAIELLEILDIPDEMKPYVTNHRINLYDYNKYEGFDNFKTDVSIAFEALSAHNDKNKLRSLFSGKNEVIESDTMKFIGTMLDIENIDKYIITNEEGVEEGHMCKAIEDLREEGAIEMAVNIIKNMMTKSNISFDEACEILSIEDKEKYRSCITSQ